MASVFRPYFKRHIHITSKPEIHQQSNDMFFSNYAKKPVLVRGYGDDHRLLTYNPSTMGRALDGWYLKVSPYVRQDKNIVERKSWLELQEDSKLIMLNHPIRETIFSKRVPEPEMFKDNDLKKREGTLFYDDYMFLTFMHTSQERVLKEDAYWSMGIWGENEWTILDENTHEIWNTKMLPGDVMYVPENMVTINGASTSSLLVSGKYVKLKQQQQQQQQHQKV